MSEVIIIIHLIVVLALVGIVLLQRSEGGGLGMGSGGGGGFMSSRGKANVLTRTTAILAGIFFLTSLVLAIMAGNGSTPRSVLDDVPATPGAPGAQGGILDQLPKSEAPKPAAPQAPISK
ncbi:MAG: preprotein translocase subunit SecG [Pseudomonadota bacterium]